MNRLRPLILVLVALALSIFGAAADPLADAERIELQKYRDYFPQFEAYADQQKSLLDEQQKTIEAQNADLTQRKSELYNYYTEYMKQFYAIDLNDKRLNFRIYENQLYSGYIILTMVVFLTVAGLALSWYQLREAVRFGRRRANLDAKNEMYTELSLSLKDAQVRTSAVGVIILIISTVSMLLYLDKVHTIPVPGPANATAADATAPQKSPTDR